MTSPVLLPAPAPRRSMPLWAKIALWVVGTTTALAAAALLWLVAGFSGGFDNLLDISHPKEGDARVVRERAQAERELSSTRPRLLDQFLASTGAAPLDVQGTHHECVEGQHNFKIDDDYDLSCQLFTAQLLLAPAGSETEVITTLHDSLTQAGLTPLYPGSALTPPDPGTSYLQAGRYTDGENTVSIELVRPEPDSYISSEALQERARTSSGAPADAQAVIQELPRDRLALVFQLDREYFRD